VSSRHPRAPFVCPIACKTDSTRCANSCSALLRSAIVCARLELDTITASSISTRPSEARHPEKWSDPNYAEAVICGRENCLKADQVREIRFLAALGGSPKEIRKKMGAIDEGQIQRVLAGRTYSRIK
jgi:hypothetical protein